MAYLLECRDKPDSAALRQETRPAHLAYAKAAPAILAAGPLLAEDESTMIGSFFILDFLLFKFNSFFFYFSSFFLIFSNLFFVIYN